MMSMLKQASARRAEKALKEILDKADDDSNGRVRLKDFMEILEANDIKVGRFPTFDHLLSDGGRRSDDVLQPC